MKILIICHEMFYQDKVRIYKTRSIGRECQNCSAPRYLTGHVNILNNSNLKLHGYENRTNFLITSYLLLGIRESLMTVIWVHTYYTFFSSSSKMRHSLCFKCGKTFLLPNSYKLHNKIEFEEDNHDLVSVLIRVVASIYYVEHSLIKHRLLTITPCNPVPA